MQFNIVDQSKPKHTFKYSQLGNVYPKESLSKSYNTNFIEHTKVMKISNKLIKDDRGLYNFNSGHSRSIGRLTKMQQGKNAALQMNQNVRHEPMFVAPSIQAGKRLNYNSALPNKSGRSHY